MDAASALGCAGWERAAETAPYVDAWGTCDLSGTEVKLYLIPDEGNYASFMDSVSPFGVTEAQMVRSGPLLVAPADQTKLDEIRAALG